MKGKCITYIHMWCDQAKWVWSRKIWFFFWHFLLGYCLGFNLVKHPQRLDNWFQRYKQLKDWTNNKKQKKLSALFGCILKTVFASYDSFCSITSHIILIISMYYCTRWKVIFETNNIFSTQDSCLTYPLSISATQTPQTFIVWVVHE